VQRCELHNIPVPLPPQDVGVDVWTFTTVEASGAAATIRFELGGDGVDLPYQCYRLYRAE